MPTRHVPSMPFQDRLGESLRRSLPKLGPEVRQQVQSLLEPEALLIMASVLLAWVVAHAFAVGEIIDLVLVGAGLFAVGWSVFVGIDHLYDFAATTYRARTESDLEIAGDHFAKAVGILGIQAVLAVIFRGAKAPRTSKGGRLNPGAAPPKTPGSSYKPKIKADPGLPAGQGSTSFWGDIKVSTAGSATDRALVLLHEKVHQVLTPKLYLLRNYRVSTRAASYIRSSLWRYLEEALAETVAQVGVNGFSKFFRGIRFPIENGYLHLMRSGGFHPSFGGQGLVKEAAGLLYVGVVVGIPFEVRFEQTSSKTNEPVQLGAP